MGTEFYRYHFERHRDEAFRAVGEMKALLESRGIGLLVFLVPVFPDPPENPGYFDNYPLQELHRKVRHEAEARGLLIHDLLDAFVRDRPRLPRYSLDIWHLDAEGHRLVAESIVPLLLGAEESPP